MSFLSLSFEARKREHRPCPLEGESERNRKSNCREGAKNEALAGWRYRVASSGK